MARIIQITRRVFAFRIVNENCGDTGAYHPIFVRRIGATIRRQATRKIGKMAALLRPVVSQAIQFSMTRGFSRLLRDIEADCCSTRASV